jgi:hypothetical protein
LRAGRSCPYAVNELIADHAGQPKGIIELRVRKQSSVRRDAGAVEIQLEPMLEIQPKGSFSGSPIGFVLGFASSAAKPLILTSESWPRHINQRTDLGNAG